MVKITRAYFYLTEHPKIAPAEFLPSDPDQVESVLKRHGVSYRREDVEEDEKPQFRHMRTMFRLVSSLT